MGAKRAKEAADEDEMDAVDSNEEENLSEIE